MGITMVNVFYLIVGLFVGLFIGSKAFRNSLVAIIKKTMNKKSAPKETAPQREAIITDNTNDNYSKAVDSLYAMGFSAQDIKTAVGYAMKQYPKGSVAELMRESLSQLGNGYKPNSRRDVHIHLDS